jgi:hypothetical protein
MVMTPHEIGSAYRSILDEVELAERHVAWLRERAALLKAQAEAAGVDVSRYVAHDGFYGRVH